MSFAMNESVPPSRVKALSGRAVLDKAAFGGRERVALLRQNYPKKPKRIRCVTGSGDLDRAPEQRAGGADVCAFDLFKLSRRSRFVAGTCSCALAPVDALVFPSIETGFGREEKKEERVYCGCFSMTAKGGTSRSLILSQASTSNLPATKLAASSNAAPSSGTEQQAVQLAGDVGREQL
ncbi:hypothetical protein IF2G_07650 [Cordyceps javanica]|nr:hypothetical protein IF2G_07650 [Cordyceps javanica]